MSEQSQDIPELTISQIFEKHKDRWIAMIVTKREKSTGQPLAGKVVGEDVDRYRLRQNVVKYNDLCIFYAGETPFPLFL